MAREIWSRCLVVWCCLTISLCFGGVAMAADGDRDGVDDAVDNCVGVFNADQDDADADGIGDACDTCPGLFNTEQGDTDEDGVGDGCDQCPLDNAKIEPGECGCGAADIDSDEDGVLDCFDGCPEDSAKTEPGLCGCGDIDTGDTDQDGEPDCLDACVDDPDKRLPGLCGCGTPDTDSDEDGTPDCFDQCPDNPDKTLPGACGCEEADADPDNDGLAACEDNCPEAPNTGQLDVDEDGVGDVCDLCPDDANPDQQDTDGDGVGDACDECPDDPDKTIAGSCGCGEPDGDPDGDSFGLCGDNCPNTANPDQDDSDGDGVGDACDVCPGVFNADQLDTDGDGLGDICDQCPGDGDKAAPGQCGCGTPDDDPDGDLLASCIDKCPEVNDPNQEDVDNDFVGDACDNCVGTANADQSDADEDGVGDLCDPCLFDGDKVEPGACGCGVADTDGDSDEVADCNDNCPEDPNGDQVDFDEDGAGDVCDGCPGDGDKVEPGVCGCGVADTDSDEDGAADCEDGCPEDGDKVEAGQCGCGVADADGDGDGVADCVDNCPFDSNSEQEDGDGDGDGDACDDYLCPAPDEVFGAEICDGRDNNCDGEVDNDAPCPPGTTCQSGECQPGRADFIVTTDDIELDPRVINVGESFSITALVRNIGAADGVNVPVNLLDMGFIIRTEVIDYLPAGGEATIVFDDLSFDERSLRIAQVRVDPDNDFEEYDEENNNATKVVRVGYDILDGRIVVEADDLNTCREEGNLRIVGRAFYEIVQDGVTYTFPVQGALVTTTIDGTVYAGARTNVHGRFNQRTDAPAIPGTYSVTISVDDSDFVGTTEITLTVADCEGGPRPGGGPRSEDVYVYSEGISFDPSDRPRLGETTQVSVEVNYFGNNVRPDISTRVFAYSPQNGQLVREQLFSTAVNFLDSSPGKQIVEFDWTNDAEGFYIIQAVVEPEFQQYTGNDKATRLIAVGEFKRHEATISLRPAPFDNLCSDRLTASIILPDGVSVEAIDFAGAGVYISEPPETQDVDGDGTQLIRAIADSVKFIDLDNDGDDDVEVDFDAAAFAAATPADGTKLIEILGFLDNADAFSGTTRVELITADADDDGFGDACDVCPDTFNPSQIDSNEDGVGDDCEVPDDDDNDDDDDDDDDNDNDNDNDNDQPPGDDEPVDNNPECQNTIVSQPLSNAYGWLCFALLLGALLIRRRRIV